MSDQRSGTRRGRANGGSGASPDRAENAGALAAQFGARRVGRAFVERAARHPRPVAAPRAESRRRRFAIGAVTASAVAGCFTGARIRNGAANRWRYRGDWRSSVTDSSSSSTANCRHPVGAPRMYARSTGMPPSRSASGAPQKKNLRVPGRPCGQRHVLLVSSSRSCADAAGGEIAHCFVAAPLTPTALYLPVVAVGAAMRTGFALVSAHSRLGVGFGRATQPEDFSQHGGARQPAEPSGDGGGGLAFGPQLFAAIAIRSSVHASSARMTPPVRRTALFAALSAGGHRCGSATLEQRVTVCDYSHLSSGLSSHYFRG